MGSRSRGRADAADPGGAEDGAAARPGRGGHRDHAPERRGRVSIINQLIRYERYAFYMYIFYLKKMPCGLCL